MTLPYADGTEVEEDEEHNPVVIYIENDYEYAVAAQYFSKQLPKK